MAIWFTFLYPSLSENNTTKNATNVQLKFTAYYLLSGTSTVFVVLLHVQCTSTTVVERGRSLHSKGQRACVPTKHATVLLGYRNNINIHIKNSKFFVFLFPFKSRLTIFFYIRAQALLGNNTKCAECLLIYFERTSNFITKYFNFIV